MDRETLLRALVDDGEAYSSCRDALQAGADFGIFNEAGDGVSAVGLTSIYRRRERLVRRKGIPTLGFVETVERLASHGGARIRIGFVRRADPPYFFQLFLASEEPRVIACLRVESRHST